ncbi:MAG: FAD-binding protein [Alphaproteobacteria bacterium]|nr:MAG: FAD-binding protein [Alphaproteobacteria bacterium]
MSGGDNAWRLPAPAGLLIDRTRPVRFRFDGRSYTGYAGDTVASALAAAGVRVLSRSFKYHRPRGILTMAGLDANTLVQIGAEPNVPADRRPIEAGMDVRPQNVFGSLRRDWAAAGLGALARFLPVGFYYRAFYRPRGAWQYVWEPLIRRFTGLGRVRFDTLRGDYDTIHGFCDVAVVGAGPAGLSAALTAAQAGAEVVLIDEGPIVGGALAYARFDVDGARAGEVRTDLTAAVTAHPAITVMSDAACNGWFADNWLPVIRGHRLHKIRAREVVLATGSLEQPAIFRNNDLPGVMMGSAAQRLIRLYGVCPGRRAVVLTGNADGYAVALDLLDAGAKVVAIVDLRPAPDCEDDPVLAAVVARGVRVLFVHAVSEALPGAGGTLDGVVIDTLTGRGTVAGQGERVACDLLVMSVGTIPTCQIAVQAGAHLSYDDAAATFTIDDLPAHLHLAGSVAGVHDLDAVLADGRRAGARAARGAGFAGSETAGETRHPSPDRGSVNHPWPILPHPKGKEFVDFDEDLQIADILNSVADGYDEIELVKRFSTVGMGPSQGRHSALATARLVAAATGRSVAEIGVTTARPPFAAEPLGVLAGRSREPERLTPMHHRHLESGARMMTAGLWWRPAWYGPPERREACIAAEVNAVRTGVGLIDVSTLGGIEVRGPDAAEFLDRMYTFAYAGQPVGRARYLLMTNEAGTIIDDGVACRLRDDLFYVTATTGGAERVYLAMLWWNVQWRLDVDIANVTAAVAAVNIAGPRSREVLTPLVEGVDLSSQAFPYMGVREGRVAGIPARLLRVGFVGELGYEIHVPSSMGEALWDALIEAGRAADLRPFGVEAQRILRLEKGHIIIGQDTDAMTFPHEVDMTWAIARKKPFFVGARSIALRAARPLARKLVGFAIDGPRAPLPRESNLVLRGGEIAGFVTSVARSPSLGKVIGLAYAAPEDSAPGATIRIKMDDGRIVEAAVVPVPFYDPDNRRQEV